MPAKLIMTWDINQEHEQEYFEFVVREFLPEVQKLGFKLSDAWVTVYGDQPQILVGAILPTFLKKRLFPRAAVSNFKFPPITPFYGHLYKEENPREIDNMVPIKCQRTSLERVAGPLSHLGIRGDAATNTGRDSHPLFSALDETISRYSERSICI